MFLVLCCLLGGECSQMFLCFCFVCFSVVLSQIFVRWKLEAHRTFVCYGAGLVVLHGKRVGHPCEQDGLWESEQGGGIYRTKITRERTTAVCT